MDKVRVLSAMSGAMMQEFSTRTAARLADYTLFKLLLPAFRTFLDINVRKEIEKDRLVIACAARPPDGEPPEANVARLLQQAREIDQKFLRQAAVFPVSIHIEYRDIEQIRRRRIERLIEAAGGLFAQWAQTPRFRAAVAQLYSRAEFESLLREILELYSVETKMLSRSVNIPQIFHIARDSLSDTVHTVMVNVAEGLAGELTRKVYRRAH